MEKLYSEKILSATVHAGGMARRGTLAALLGVFSLLAMGGAPMPAQADEPHAWEAACAYKIPSGIAGTGFAVTADYCRRLRECETMADKGMPNMPVAGCFGYQPASRQITPRR